MEGGERHQRASVRIQGCGVPSVVGPRVLDLLPHHEVLRAPAVQQILRLLHQAAGAVEVHRKHFVQPHLLADSTHLSAEQNRAEPDKRAEQNQTKEQSRTRRKSRTRQKSRAEKRSAVPDESANITEDMRFNK